MTKGLRFASVGAAGVLALLGVARRAYAADPSEDELIRQGVEARRRQDDSQALELFGKAYVLRKSPRAEAQMGLAEIALGRWLDAEAHLDDATQATSDPWIRKNAKALTEALDRIRREELGTLEVMGSPDGAEVVFGGEVRGTLPLARPIRARVGEVHFELRAPGYETEARTVRVVPGRLTRETVSLVERAAGPAGIAAPAVPGTSVEPAAPAGVVSISPPSIRGGRSWQRPVAAVIASAGMLLVAGGVTAQILSSGKNAEFNAVTDAPNPSGQCDQALANDGGGVCPSLLGDAHDRLKLAIIGYAAGGVALVGSLVLYLTAPSRTGGRGPEATAACLPAAGSGLSCVLSFVF